MAFIPSNVKRFNYQSTNARDFSALCNLSGANGYVIYSPLQQNIYSWVIPEGGIPKEEHNCWSTFKTINETNSGPITLWERESRGGCPKSFEEMVHNHYPCYIIPMKDLMYAFWYSADAIRSQRADSFPDTKYKFLINNEGKHYSIRRQGDEMTCSLLDTVKITLYNLYDNTSVPGTHCGVDKIWRDYIGSEQWHAWQNDLMGGWQNDSGWQLPPFDESVTPDRRPQTPDQELQVLSSPQTPSEPRTPPPPAARRNLMDEFEDDIDMDMDDQGSSSEFESSEEDSSASAAAEDEEIANIADGIPVSDEEESSADEVEAEVAGGDDQDSEYEPDSESEEDEEDVSDEEEEEKRMDDSDGEWYTKSEFYEWYGCWAVWRAMDPRKQLKRRALTCAYELGASFPWRIRHKFINDFLETY